jgi:hypothetical protein
LGAVHLQFGEEGMSGIPENHEEKNAGLMGASVFHLFDRCQDVLA